MKSKNNFKTRNSKKIQKSKKKNPEIQKIDLKNNFSNQKNLKKTKKKMTTTAQIFQQISEIQNTQTEKSLKADQKRNQKRKEEETLLISKNPVCAIQKNPDLENLYKLEPAEFEKVIHDNFYNTAVLSALFVSPKVSSIPILTLMDSLRM